MIKKSALKTSFVYLFIYLIFLLSGQILAVQRDADNNSSCPFIFTAWKFIETYLESLVLYFLFKKEN